MTPMPMPQTLAGRAYLAQPQRQLEGRLTVNGGSVAFRAADDDAVFELPIDGLEAALTGVSYELILLSHPSHAGITLSGPSAELVKIPALAPICQKLTGKRRRGRAILPAILLVMFAAIVGVILLRGPIIGLFASWVPASFEVAVGDLFFQQVRLEKRLIEGSEITTGLDQLASRLLSAVPKSDHVIELHLADDATLNAFALPGGHIVIHSGVILQAESAEEVLGVLAHEIGHVKRRHSLRQVIGSIGVYAVAQALIGDLSGIAGVIAEGSLNLLSLKFSRGQELDADDVGWDYLIASRIDPRGMLSFFERIEAEMKEKAGAAAELEGSLNFLSTHPITAERRDLLDARFKALESRDFQPVDFDFKAFQDAIAQTVEAKP